MPILLVVVALVVASDNSNFLPGIFFVPMAMAAVAPALLIGGAAGAAFLLMGRAPDGRRLTPQARKAAALWGAGCTGITSVAMFLFRL